MNQLIIITLHVIKKYTAVKRSPSEPTPCDIPPAKQPKIQTRTCSSLPKNDEIKGKCLFCGMNRKQVKGKEEARQYVRTVGG